MTPRRMDGFGQAQRPAQRSTQRPMGQAADRRPLNPRPAGMAADGGSLALRPSQPVRRPMAADPKSRPVSEAPFVAPARRKGGAAVLLQFVVGLVVIVAVAATVVWLWVKYYQ
jgi:hypothetical protein